MLVPTGGFGWVIGDQTVAEFGTSECTLGLGADEEDGVQAPRRSRAAAPRSSPSLRHNPGDTQPRSPIPTVTSGSCPPSSFPDCGLEAGRGLVAAPGDVSASMPASCTASRSRRYGATTWMPTGSPAGVRPIGGTADGRPTTPMRPVQS